MINRIITDTFEQLAETGQAVVQQAKQITPGKIVSSAMEQVSGSNPSTSSSIPLGLEDLKQAKKTPAQMMQMKQTSQTNTQKQLDNTRINLNRIIRQRYEKMQNEVLTEEHKAEQEEEQKKRQEEMEKEEKKKQAQQQVGPVGPPKGPKSKGMLGVVQKQQQGTGEVRTAKIQ